MIDRKDTQQILEAAIKAPSGENAQPWKFVVKGDTVDLFNVPERDQSLYNWQQRASYIANGAALENLIIAARHFGYDQKVTLFPDSDKEHIASVQLVPGSQKEQKDDLYPYIEKRVTNRKPYDTKSLDRDEVMQLAEIAKSSKVAFYLTTKEEDKAKLGQAGSTNERVMLSNKSIHHFFFTHVNWTKAEDDEKKIGFFIDTLELPPPARAMFRLFRKWPVMNAFNKIKFNEVVGKQNGATNAKAGGFGLLTIPDTKQTHLVEAGRILERVWLTATKMGLQMQPLTGVLFFMLAIRDGQRNAFSEKQISLIESAYRDIQAAFMLEHNEVPVFMFRIGRGDEPTARASRFNLEEVTETTK